MKITTVRSITDQGLLLTLCSRTDRLTLYNLTVPAKLFRLHPTFLRSLCLSVCLSVSLYLSLSLILSLPLSVPLCLSLSLSLLSLPLSLFLSLSFSLSFSLSLYIYLSIYLSSTLKWYKYDETMYSEMCLYFGSIFCLLLIFHYSQILLRLYLCCNI